MKRRPYLTRKRIEEAHKRIQARVLRRFPKGCTVRLLRRDAHLWPRYQDSVGTVVGYACERTAIKVRFDGYKGAKSWSYRLFRPWPPKRVRSAER